MKNCQREMENDESEHRLMTIDEIINGSVYKNDLVSYQGKHKSSVMFQKYFRRNSLD